jgi:acyl-CoA synthetase (AMP-forming)/AMP-acid ligase II
VKIVDPATGETLPRGDPGEVCARGYQTMLGSFERPEESAATLDTAGWLHTGDVGRWTGGYLTITGRLKDMIIRGGENVYPRELEDLLHTYPGIAEVAVIGIRDEHWGERVAAVVSPVDHHPTPGNCTSTAAPTWPSTKHPPTGTSPAHCPEPPRARSRSSSAAVASRQVSSCRHRSRPTAMLRRPNRTPDAN